MKTRKINVSIIYVFGALGGLLFGYDTGIISGAILYIKDDFRLNALSVGFVVSAILFGAVIGAIFSSKLSEKYGRRKTIMIAGVVFCIGALGSAYSMTTGQLVLFRIVLGLAVGAVSALVPMYLSEIAPANIRGAVSGLNQVMIIAGMVAAYVTNYAFSNVHNGWRFMLGFAFVPAIILVVGMLVLPESPRWLFKVGKETEARDVLNMLRKGKNIDGEIDEIRKACSQKEGSLKDLFSKQLRPAVTIGAGLAFFQQVVGCNTIYYYAPTIISHTGLGKSASILGTIGVGTLNLIVVIIAAGIVDKVGRKKLLMIGNIGMSASLMLLWISNNYLGNTLMASYITVAMLGVYILFFGLSFGPITWIMIGEIFPLNVRGLGAGFSSAVNWVSNILVSLTFPILLQIMGTAIFGVYAAIGIVSFIFVYYKVTETKGKSLEEIEFDFKKMSRSM